MVTKGFSKTTSLMVSISLETWNYTAAELQDICACLFILLALIFNQGLKCAEQAGYFVTHSSRPLCVDMFWKRKVCFFMEVIEDCESGLSQSAVTECGLLMNLLLERSIKCIMNTVTDPCSFVTIFAFILPFDYRQYRHTFYSILRVFFNKFPENNIFYLLRFCSLWASGKKLWYSLHVENTNMKKNSF